MSFRILAGGGALQGGQVSGDQEELCEQRPAASL